MYKLFLDGGFKELFNRNKHFLEVTNIGFCALVDPFQLLCQSTHVFILKVGEKGKFHSSVFIALDLKSICLQYDLFVLCIESCV